MRALAAFLLCAATLGLALSSGACSSASDLLPDTGLPDAGPFAVSGTVSTFPLATHWYAEQGKSSPSRDGLSVRLEDPFVAAHFPDAGVDVASTVAEDGRFAFFAVDGRLAVGMAALVTDPRAPALVIPSESFLFEGGPQSVSGTDAYALPADFAGALAAATRVADLEEQGFLLGVVHDATGHPVAGAGIVGHDLDNTRVRYLADDLTLVPDGNATGATGAFLVPGRLDLMNFSVVGLEGYSRRKAQVLPGRAFLIVFQP
ncbi:MAG TPA: hypothetical protein VGK67_01265 [Myxococcales bacterium]